MKITAINVSTLNVPAPPPRNTYYPNNAYVVARIRTDEGIEGLGYTMLVGADGLAWERSGYPYFATGRDRWTCCNLAYSSVLSAWSGARKSPFSFRGGFLRLLLPLD